MKNKVIQKFFTVLLGLVMVGTASAGTSYCNDEMASTVGWTGNYTLSIGKLGTTQTQITVSVASEEITGFYQFKIENSGNGTTTKTIWDPGDTEFTTSSNFSVANDKKSATIIIDWTTYPTSDVQFHMVLRRNNDANHGFGSDIFGNTLSGIDVSATCGGGGDEDTEAPVMTSASLESKTHNSAVIAVAASDNVGVTKYVVYNSASKIGEYAPSDGKITVTGLTPSTAYTLTIKAKDAAGNESVDGKEVQFTTNGDPKADNTECSGWEDAISEGTKSAAGYNYKFTTEGTSVKVEIEFLEDFTGGEGYMWDETSGFSEIKATVNGKKVTHTFTNKTSGDALKFRIKLAYAGGMTVTKQFTYTVGEDCEEPGPTPELTDPELTITDPSAVAIELAIGATKQITWTSLNAATPTFASSKESVATVSDAGVITAKAIGSATITVKQEETDTYQEATKTITVTVPGDKSKNTECSGWNDDIWASEGGYTYKFSTSGTTVHIEFTAIGNFPGGFTNPQVYLPDVNEFKSMTQSGKVLSYDFENQTTDSDLKIKGYFPREAGTDETQVYTYTVGEDCQPHPVTGVTITNTFTQIEVGQSKTMTAAITPANATNKNVTWSITSGSDYASINNEGTLTGNAEGEVTIQVETEDGNKTATKTIIVVAAKPTAPTEAPAAPTVPANQVKAVYSATYSADCGFGYDWGSDTQYTQDTYGKKYVNGGGGYFGMVGFNHNCSQMEKLHLDVWALEACSFRVVPIYKNPQSQLDDKGVTITISDSEAKAWKSVDIALNEGEFAQITDWSNIYQIKIDQAPNLTLWLNNVYFYTTQTKTTCALSASVKNNEGGAASVSVAEVTKGGSATFTAVAACGYSFVGWWNNSTKVSTEATYTPTDIQEDLTLVAEFSFVGPSEAATVKTYDQMISIYGVGTPITGVMMNPYWEDATQKNMISVAGKQMWKYSTINYFGIDFDGNRQDVSAMKYVHLDIWSNASGEIKFYLIWNGGESPVTIQLVGGQWNSINILLTNWSTENLKTIRQLKFNAKKNEIGNNGIEGATILVQDIFFYAPNEFTLSEEDDNTENLTTFSGKVCDVTIARTFEAGNLYTLALPFDMTEAQVAETFGTCTMYKLADSYWKVEGENMYIRFAPVTEFKAGTPILFTPTEDIENAVAKDVTIDNVTCETATDLVTFHGTYSKMGLAAHNYILAADQYLYPVVGDDYSINGMRGYFSWGAAVTGAPKMARVILHEEITTDNALVPAAQGATKKVMENGRFVIIRDGKSYNAQGLIIQ